MNANNNTYSCLRTINATHNFLYCEFVTGLVTFYNLRIGKIMNNPHIWFVFHVSKNLVSIHIHFIYMLVEVDQREFAHTCTYHILVCFSQNGHILSCFCFFFKYEYLITLWKYFKVLCSEFCDNKKIKWVINICCKHVCIEWIQQWHFGKCLQNSYECRILWWRS